MAFFSSEILSPRHKYTETKFQVDRDFNVNRFSEQKTPYQVFKENVGVYTKRFLRSSPKLNSSPAQSGSCNRLGESFEPAGIAERKISLSQLSEMSIKTPWNKHLGDVEVSNGKDRLNWDNSLKSCKLTQIKNDNADKIINMSDSPCICRSCESNVNLRNYFKRQNSNCNCDQRASSHRICCPDKSNLEDYDVQLTKKYTKIVYIDENDFNLDSEHNIPTDYNCSNTCNCPCSGDKIRINRREDCSHLDKVNYQNESQESIRGSKNLNYSCDSCNAKLDDILNSLVRDLKTKWVGMNSRSGDTQCCTLNALISNIASKTQTKRNCQCSQTKTPPNDQKVPIKTVIEELRRLFNK